MLLVARLKLFSSPIPPELMECFEQLRRVLSDEELTRFKDSTKEDLAFCHAGIGAWIRENWGLWEDSPLSSFFNSMGVSHADDMSGIIIKSFHRYLNGEDIGLAEQIKTYQEYWKKAEIECPEPFPEIQIFS